MNDVQVAGNAKEASRVERSPGLSIIIVVLNAKHDFEHTIGSVLKQRCRDFEIVVIDGNSDDGVTRAIIETYRSSITHYVSEPDRGIYDAMNKGLRLARGEFVTFLNCGDQYADESVLSMVVDTEHGDHDIVYGDALLTNENGDIVGRQRALPFTEPKLVFWGTRVVCHQAMFVRRRVSPEYNIKYKYKGELNWYFDLVKSVPQERILKLDIPIVKYQLGGAGTDNFKRNLRERIQLVRERYGVGRVILGIPVYCALILFYLRVRKTRRKASASRSHRR